MTSQKTNRVVAIVEARMSSSRLPGKVLMEMSGKPVLGHIVDRLKRSKKVDDVCIATTLNPACDALVDYCESIGVSYFRGSEDDVLDRVLKAAYYAEADIIVEICADCPVIDPEVIDELVELYSHHKVDFVSNAIKRVHPLGLDAKVFSRDALLQVANSTDDPNDREHVSLYFYENPEKFKLFHLKDDRFLDEIHYRLTLDTTDDFKMINAVYDALHQNNPKFGLQEVVDFLRENQQILEINSFVKQKPVRA